jgi:excisionase family DNA binding protein
MRFGKRKPMDQTREIMTVSDVAAFLHVHPATVYKMLKHRELPGFRIGSDWRFNRAEILGWIKEKQESAIVKSN